MQLALASWKPASRISREEFLVPGGEEPHGHFQTSKLFQKFQNCPHAAFFAFISMTFLEIVDKVS
jgi:hypothetical protein